MDTTANHGFRFRLYDLVQHVSACIAYEAGGPPPSPCLIIILRAEWCSGGRQNTYLCRLPYMADKLAVLHEPELEPWDAQRWAQANVNDWRSTRKPIPPTTEKSAPDAPGETP